MMTANIFLVSVIIPNPTLVAYVSQMIGSISAQTCRVIEVLVREKCFFDGIEEVFGLESCTS
jgi:hypothetical protein